MEPIAEELKQFIFACLETVDQLRILLLLQANPARAWSPASVSTSLFLPSDVVQKGLDALRQKNLLVVSDNTESLYRYQAANADLEQIVHAVAELDRTRPVTLIKLIYSRPKHAR